MERLIEPRTAPSAYVGRFEVVLQPGLRHERLTSGMPLGRPLSLTDALKRLELRRLGLEACGADMLPSLNWANTWEGTRGGETFSLYVRKVVEGSN